MSSMVRLTRRCKRCNSTRYAAWMQRSCCRIPRSVVKNDIWIPIFFGLDDWSARHVVLSFTRAPDVWAKLVVFRRAEFSDVKVRELPFLTNSAFCRVLAFQSHGSVLPENTTLPAAKCKLPGSRSLIAKRLCARLFQVSLMLRFADMR